MEKRHLRVVSKKFPEETHGTVALPGFYDGLKTLFFRSAVGISLPNKPLWKKLYFSVSWMICTIVLRGLPIPWWGLPKSWKRHSLSRLPAGSAEKRHFLINQYFQLRRRLSVLLRTHWLKNCKSAAGASLTPGNWNSSTTTVVQWAQHHMPCYRTEVHKKKQLPGETLSKQLFSVSWYFIIYIF